MTLGPKPVRLGVLGASGRMGRAVVRLARDADMTVVLAVASSGIGHDAGELAGVGAIGVPVVEAAEDLANALESARVDVLIDFSSPTALAAACEACRATGVALVSGTTGIDEHGHDSLSRAAEQAAVLWEPNMSVGVHVLASLVAKASSALGAGYDIELVEVHHRAKVDAPSGTALRLVEAVELAKVMHVVHGRSGRPGPRPSSELGVHAVRGGDVVGDHTVFFLGDGERIELTHRASNRDLFARGALRAAAWLAAKRPGRYSLANVVEGG